MSCTYMLLTWVLNRLDEPIVLMYHKCKSIWENPLNDEEFTFIHWTNIFVACIAAVGIFEDNRPVVYNKSWSESFEICWNYFKIDISNYDLLHKTLFGKIWWSPVIHQNCLSLFLPNIHTIWYVRIGWLTSGADTEFFKGVWGNGYI